MSRPVYIIKGRSNPVSQIHNESDTILFGSQYHFLNFQKYIKINGYITPDTTEVYDYSIDLDIRPSINTKLELYIYNDGTDMGDGNVNLGINGAEPSYKDSEDFRFFFANVGGSSPAFYFDMYNARVYTSSNIINNANYKNRLVKIECGKNSQAYMKVYRYSDNYLIYSGTSSCSANVFTWERGHFYLESYTSNNQHMKWQLIRIYEGDEKIRELYPKYKKDYGWCFFDNVSKQYFYNPNQAPWIYTESEEQIVIENIR